MSYPYPHYGEEEEFDALESQNIEQHYNSFDEDEMNEYNKYTDEDIENFYDTLDCILEAKRCYVLLQSSN